LFLLCPAADGNVSSGFRAEGQFPVADHSHSFKQVLRAETDARSVHRQ
jgi:hypothetical protein